MRSKTDISHVFTQEWFPPMPYHRSYDVIGYTYEAGIHCLECTKSRFPNMTGIDREGNEISPYFVDDWSEGDACDDCNEGLL